MQYTMLGKTDLHVSRLCFGTWALGGDWGAVDLAQNRAAIRKALDLGLNFLDTAQAYGWGASESALGEALRPELKGRRHDVVLATKGGLRLDGNDLLRSERGHRRPRAIERHATRTRATGRRRRRPPA